MSPSAQPAPQAGRNEIVAVVSPDSFLYPKPEAAIARVDAEPQGELIAQTPGDESDDDTLEDLASQIRSAHIEVTRASEAAKAFAIRAGQLLQKARRRVPKGAWKAWLLCNCDFTAVYP